MRKLKRPVFWEIAVYCCDWALMVCPLQKGIKLLFELMPAGKEEEEEELCFKSPFGGNEAYWTRLDRERKE